MRCVLSIIPLAFCLVYACTTGRKSDINVFYINTQEDFDRYSGNEFPKGTQILFAVGMEFNGEFVIKGSGTEDNPNLVSAYDPESQTIFSEWIENKPVINGLGMVNAPLYLYNGQFWEINNLEVTNTDGTDEDQGDLRGIHVVAENSGTMENITIKNCHVHDVNGKVGGKQRGGIHIDVLGDSIKTKYHNLLVQGNVIKNVGGVGISNQSSWPKIDSEDYYPWTNYVIRDNHVELTGRNGIIVRYSIDPLVEYNVLAYNSRYSTG